jgi:hypothetical protein
MSSKADFIDWKSHPVTKQVFEGLREQEATVAETLAVSAGVDPLQDRYHVGYIAALRDFYLIRLEDEDAK